MIIFIFYQEDRGVVYDYIHNVGLYLASALGYESWIHYLEIGKGKGMLMRVLLLTIYSVFEIATFQ